MWRVPLFPHLCLLPSLLSLFLNGLFYICLSVAILPSHAATATAPYGTGGIRYDIERVSADAAASLTALTPALALCFAGARRGERWRQGVLSRAMFGSWCLVGGLTRHLSVELRCSAADAVYHWTLRQNGLAALARDTIAAVLPARVNAFWRRFISRDWLAAARSKKRRISAVAANSGASSRA